MPKPMPVSHKLVISDALRHEVHMRTRPTIYRRDRDGRYRPEPYHWEPAYIYNQDLKERDAR